MTHQFTHQDQAVEGEGAAPPIGAEEEEKKIGQLPGSPEMASREKKSSSSPSGGSFYQCSVAECAKRFRSSKELNRHLSKTHGIQRSYKCQICTLSFPKRKALQEHVQKHISGNRYFCEEHGCNKTFADKSSLKYHISVHVSLPPL